MLRAGNCDKYDVNDCRQLSFILVSKTAADVALIKKNKTPQYHEIEVILVVRKTERREQAKVSYLLVIWTGGFEVKCCCRFFLQVC